MQGTVFYLVIGFIVSMDAMALTIARRETYTQGFASLLWWASLNALWHGGLLVFYIFLFHLAVNWVKQALEGIDLEWLRIQLPMLADKFAWLVGKLKIHLLSIFATITMALVWVTYSKKVTDSPLVASVGNLPYGWMRALFRQFNRWMSSSIFHQNVQAAIVAVDMLALAALIKATEQTNTPHDRILMTAVVSASVFVLVTVAGYVARLKFAEADRTGDDGPSEISRTLAKLWILITLRLAEPLLIFYFLMQLLARLATGIHFDSPAFLVASAVMVLAIVEMNGLSNIVEAVRKQSDNGK